MSRPTIDLSMAVRTTAAPVRVHGTATLLTVYEHVATSAPIALADRVGVELRAPALDLIAATIVSRDSIRASDAVLAAAARMLARSLDEHVDELILAGAAAG